MDFKTDLQHWYKACQAFDFKDYPMALDTLLICCPSSKIYFNIGIILVTLHDHQNALDVFAKAIELDPYFSAAYFQSGVSNIMLGDFGQAVKCFDLAYKSLRGNKAINYRQLGLDFTLYACEILYNRGMCQIYLDNTECGMADLNQAQQLKMNNQHEIIEQATRDTERSTFGVYSIPPTVIYRPTACQLRLLENIDSLLNTSCYDYTTQQRQQLFILESRHHYPYRRIPKYLSKYLQSMINTKIKALPPPPPPPLSPPATEPETTAVLSANMTHHLHTMSPTPFSRSHSPLSYFLSSPHQQRMKQQQISTQQNKQTSDNHFNNKDKRKSAKCAARHQQDGEKFKIKLHYKDTRIMMIDANTTYEDVLIKVHEKLDLPGKNNNNNNNNNNNFELELHCMDGDGVLKPLMDDEGWSFVKCLNRDPRQFESNNNRMACIGKIEIWCK